MTEFLIEFKNVTKRFENRAVLELDSVMPFAELSQKPIAQLQCEIPTASQKN